MKVVLKTAAASGAKATVTVNVVPGKMDTAAVLKGLPPLVKVYWGAVELVWNVR